MTDQDHSPSSSLIPIRCIHDYPEQSLVLAKSQDPIQGWAKT